MIIDKDINAFFELLKAGMWGRTPVLSSCPGIDFERISSLAEEQSVVGLVAAGIEFVDDFRIPQAELLSLIGKALIIERRNLLINVFVSRLVKRLQEKDISALLVKGQGVAQCYSRPLWRSSGDVDLLFNKTNYEKAKFFLSPVADRIDIEDNYKMHQALVIKGFDVELHGRMPFAMSKKVDDVIDVVINESVNNDAVRIWHNNGVDIFLPCPDNDVIIIFTHFLHHFFIEGVGLRQVCDWCRLLWVYGKEIDTEILESRLKKMGLMSEWRVFASLSVNWLGMPKGEMPLYVESRSYNIKAKRALAHILKSGNLGHNNDNSYRVKHSSFISNLITTCRRVKDFVGFSLIFPIDSPCFFFSYMKHKIL